MASFTDLIPQFNPYIQQLPVEAMVTVGMEKQKRYDEGIQKLQSQIDQIAGISVLRGVDKAYLQSKLNELGNNLKGVAAGDFSNFQLVNSVGGMVGQLSKDPYVMAAVKSTAQDQKNAEFMESERKAGKLDPANVHVYNLQRSKYLNAGLSDEDGQPVVFSGQYEPYKNVYEKLSKIAKDVGVDETIIQNMFNPDGSINRVMVETTLKGKDANKIYDAFINGLDAGDYRQLQINGIYKYKDRSGEDLLNTLQTSNNEYIAISQDKKTDIEDNIATLNKKLASAKPSEAAEISKQIVQLQAVIKQIDDNIASSNEVLSTSKEKLLEEDEDYMNTVRGQIHTNNFLKGLSKSFSEKISHVKYLDNPLWKAIMDEKKLDLERRKVAAAERANELKEKELFPVIAATAPIPGKSINFAETINQQFSDMVGERDGELTKLARWEMKRLGWDDKKMSQWAKDQAKAKGISEQDAMVAFGTTTLTKIKNGSLAPTSEIVSSVSSLGNLNNLIAGFDRKLRAADEQARQQSGPDAKSTVDILRETKPIVAKVGGKDVTLSAQDQLDLARYVSYRREIFSTKGEDEERKIAIARLENKYGAYANPLFGWAESEYAKTPSWTKKIFGSPIGLVQSLYKGSPGELSSFQKVMRTYTGNQYESYKETQDQVYKESFLPFYPKNETFAISEKSRPTFRANMSAMFIDHPNFPEMMKQFDSGKSNIVVTSSPSLTGFGGQTGLSMRVAGEDGVTSESIEISPEQYRILLQKNPDMVDQTVSLTESIVNGSPDKSSNVNGLGSVPTAYFGRTDFPYVTSNIAGGDFIRDGKDPNVYYPKVYYVPTGGDTTIIDIGTPMSLRDVMGFPQMLTDGKFKQILRNN